MSKELFLESKFGQPYLLNDDYEKEVEMNLNIMASDEFRSKIPLSNNYDIDLCVVLDISPSMYDQLIETTYDSEVCNIQNEDEKTKLDIAIKEIKELIEILRENDTLSLVTYDDDAYVIFKNIKGIDKGTMHYELSQIRNYKKDRNIASGLREARKILMENNNSNTIKRIIFLTDGVQHEEYSEELIISEVNLLNKVNISIDCVGLGNDYDFDLLEKIAMPSNGKTCIITSNEEKRVFTELFQGAQEVIITEARIKLKFSKLVEVDGFFKGMPQNFYFGRAQLNEDREIFIDVGQIEKSQKYAYYFEIKIPAQKDYEGPLRIAEAEVEYLVPMLYGDEVMSLKDNIIIQFGSDASLVKTDGEMKNNFRLAYIKKNEFEMERAKKLSDYTTTIRTCNEIMKTYRELNFEKELSIYSYVFDQYKKGGNISNSISNEFKNLSSKCGNKGVLKQAIPKGFLKHINRRGGI